jgi:hypothetical protein
MFKKFETREKSSLERNRLDKKVLDLGQAILERDDFKEGRKMWSKFYYIRGLKKYPTLQIDDFIVITFI